MLHTNALWQYANMAYSCLVILLIHHRRFNKIDDVKSAIVSANIAYKSNMYHPTFEICISYIVRLSNLLFISWFHIRIKLKRVPKLNKSTCAWKDIYCQNNYYTISYRNAHSYFCLVHFEYPNNIHCDNHDLQNPQEIHIQERRIYKNNDLQAESISLYEAKIRYIPKIKSYIFFVIYN